VDPEKKALLPAKASPKVKSSPRWIRVSLHGSYAPLLSPMASVARAASARASSSGAETEAAEAMAARFAGVPTGGKFYQL
jgi:hypothetical protein